MCICVCIGYPDFCPADFYPAHVFRRRTKFLFSGEWNSIVKTNFIRPDKFSHPDVWIGVVGKGGADSLSLVFLEEIRDMVLETPAGTDKSPFYHRTKFNQCRWTFTRDGPKSILPPDESPPHKYQWAMYCVLILFTYTPSHTNTHNISLYFCFGLYFWHSILARLCHFDF